MSDEMMADHKTGTRDKWLAARAELPEREKEFSRMSDELAEQRRDLPSAGRGCPLWRDRELGLWVVHRRALADRDDVAEALLIETDTKRRVVFVGLVGEDRPARDLPGDCLANQRRGQLRLRLETHVVGDLRPPPPLEVIAPVRRQVQRPAQRQRAALPDGMKRHADLAVSDLAKRARVLPLDAGRATPILGETGVVNDPAGHLDTRRDTLCYIPQQIIRGPRRVRQELLHRLIPRTRLAQPKTTSAADSCAARARSTRIGTTRR
jgi:hypothetical protein